MSVHVRDVMVPVLSAVPAGCPLPQAARLMRSWDTRESLVVADDGSLCGLLRDTDIVVFAIASGRSPAELSAADCCDPDVPRLDADQFVTEAIGLMRHHQVRRVPVVEGSQLLGTVWLSDLEAAARTAAPGHRTSAPPAPASGDRARRPLRPGPATPGSTRRPAARGAASVRSMARWGEI